MQATEDAPSLRLRVVLPEGEITQWIGESLSVLAASPRIALQIHRTAPRFSEYPSSALSRWWRRRIPSLCSWQPSGEDWFIGACQETADNECDAMLFLASQPSPKHLRQANPNLKIWLLADGMHRILNQHFPLLEPVCSGDGIRLNLLEYRPTTPSWPVSRTLHRSACTRYCKALDELSAALVQLVKQAAIDRLLELSKDCEGSCIASQTFGVVAGPPPATTPEWKLGLLGELRCRFSRFQENVVSEYWRIGVLDIPIGQVALHEQLPPVAWLTPEQSTGYWADPCGLPGVAGCLACEFVDERSGVGHLEVLHIDRGQVSGRNRLSIGSGRHISFPNVIELNGRRLGVAETGACRECLLYEIDARGNWQPLFPLLSNVAAADPALFVWQGRYWLAYTDADLGTHDNLCLCYADVLDGPWKPHANNPVKIDVSSARMAGAPYWHNGILYRPGQDCLRTYGAAVVVHRIEQLTPTSFVEVPVRRISPDATGQCPDGLHTLNAWGEKTLIDGKRHGFNPVVFARKIRRRLARHLAVG